MEATALIKFKGDTKDVDEKTKKVNSNISAMAKGISSAFKVATAAITAASAAVGVIVKQSADAYAEFEQLEGGLISLFGEGSAEMNNILGKSEEAYKNLTMSQNEYLTAFQSAYPLVNAGLSENADSVEYTNKMLQISADLFNTYGGSVEQYQSAINWALKGSFVYLDNLNLGIKGTQEGFIEAANASGVLGKNIKDVSELTSNEIIDVISHYAEEYGVLGKTAAEASDTIIGSLNMTKASWQNFVSGIAKDNADLNKLIDELINSAMAFGNNILPVIERILIGIASALPTLINNIVEILPGLVEQILPPLINAGVDLIVGLINAVSQILPTLFDEIMKGIVQLVKALAPILPDLIRIIFEGILTIITALAEMMPELMPIIVDAIAEIIPMLIEMTPLFIKAGGMLLGAILEGIIRSLPSLLSGTKNVANSVVDVFKAIPGMLWDVGVNIVKGLWNGMAGIKDWVISKVKALGKSILSGLKSVLGIHSPSKEFAVIGKYSVLGYTEALDKMDSEVQKQIAQTFGLSPEISPNNSMHYSPTVQVYNNVDIQQDPLGQMVSNIKTFSGGAKNDYNYGAGV